MFSEILFNWSFSLSAVRIKCFDIIKEEKLTRITVVTDIFS